MNEFRRFGKEVIDWVCDYVSSVEQRRVIPDVQPGYLRPLLPESAPRRGEDFAEVLRDVERVIMPGMTHWQHPRFHAYFPAGNCFPSVLAGLISDALGCNGFSWAACPAYTELEIVMMDWMGALSPSLLPLLLTRTLALYVPSTVFVLCVNVCAARALGLPQHFEHSSDAGGGVLQGCASDCILLAMLAGTVSIIALQYTVLSSIGSHVCSSHHQ